MKIRSGNKRKDVTKAQKKSKNAGFEGILNVQTKINSRVKEM